MKGPFCRFAKREIQPMKTYTAIVIAGFPAAFVGILFTGSLLIEVIFSLDGIGLLGYDAVIKRDYSILFGTLFAFTLIGLIMHLVGDLVYVLVDPRIDFETRET